MPRDGSSTKQRILDTAERLVIENGFAATTLDEVISGSRTSKGSFFHHFDSKLDLARALVARYAAADVAHLQRALRAVEPLTDDPAAQVIAFVRYFEDGADELMAAQSSCLYVSILAERQLAQAGTGEEILGAVTAWRQAVSALVVRAFRSLPAAPPIEPDALADHLFVTFEGAFVLSRTTGDPGHMRAQLRVLRQLLGSLLGGDA